MEAWADFGDLIETYVTIAALVVGGIWTYWMFIKNRAGFPRIKPEILCTPVQIEQGWLLRVDLVVENIGTSLAKPLSAELRLRQILPMPTEVESLIAKGYDPVNTGETQIIWPCLAQQSWPMEKLGFEIEPGETAPLHADFFVSNDIRVVELYFFLGNPKKSNKGIGWNQSKVIELGE